MSNDVKILEKEQPKELPLVGWAFIPVGGHTLFGKVCQDETQLYLEPAYIYKVTTQYKINRDTGERVEGRDIRSLHPLLGCPEVLRHDLLPQVCGISVDQLSAENRAVMAQLVEEYEAGLRTMGIRIPRRLIRVV
jgi:hypothetical protein